MYLTNQQKESIRSILSLVADSCIEEAEKYNVNDFINKKLEVRIQFDDLANREVGYLYRQPFLTTNDLMED
jgi:hypothetical protein